MAIKVVHSFNWFSIKKAGGTSDLMFKIVKAQEKNPELYPAILSSDDSFDYSLKDQLKKTYFIISKSIIKSLNINLSSLPNRDLKKFNPDLIHMHVYRSIQNIFIYIYCITNKVPYVMDAHGSVPFWGKGKIKKKIYDFLIGKRIMLGASAWIAETEVGIKEYTELFPSITGENADILSPPFGVDEFLKLPETSDLDFRKKYGLTDDSIIITFLGRLHQGKGNDFLLKGISRVSKTRKNLYCMLVGADDGHEETLRNLSKELNIEDRVIFVGFKSGYEKNEILKCSNIVVQLSRFEQGAWAPLEGVLCKTPIIVTDHTGTGEDIKRLDAGYLVKMDDIDDLEEKINFIINNYDSAYDKTLKARKYIIDNLSMDARMGEYIDIYKKVLSLH